MNSATDGSAVTAGTPTVYYTIDGGTQATGSGTSTHEGNGQWSYAPTQAETNGDHLAYTMAISGAISQTVNIYTTANLVDDVWDEALNKADHNVAQSAGKRIRQIDAAFVLHAGTAQAASSNTLTLDAGANSNDDFYNHAKVIISAGTGTEQERIIVDYNGTTKVATIAPPWITVPDNTSDFEVEPGLGHCETGWATIKVGLVQAATSTTITLDSTASAVDDFYNKNVVHIDAGTGEGQTRTIDDYNGTTKVATVHSPWTVTPDTTSEYIVEESPHLLSDLNDGIIYGSAATGTLSTTQATSDLTGYTDDQLIGRVIIWTSGAAEGEGTDITDYASASGLLTFTALTTAPANGDTFKIV